MFISIALIKEIIIVAMLSFPHLKYIFTLNALIRQLPDDFSNVKAADIDS